MADRTKTYEGRSSREIEGEIQRTRLEMDETVDELSRRVSPRYMMEELWDKARADDGMGVTRLVKEHPLPIGFMGLGLGWLAVEEATGRSVTADSFRGNDERQRGRRVGPPERRSGRAGTFLPEGRERRMLEPGRRQDDGDGGNGQMHGSKAKELLHKAGELKDRAAERVSTAAEKVKSVTSQGTEKASQGKEMASQGIEKASNEAHRAADRTRQAAERTKRAADRTKDEVEEFMDKRPLVMGAIAFGVGLASGIGIPSSEAEDRFMGEASDATKETASEAADEISAGDSEETPGDYERSTPRL